MKVNSYYPVLCVSNMKESIAFYKANFAFEAAFENDWYTHLTMNGNSHVNLAIMDSTHESVPESFRNKAQGVLLNFELDDVDAFYAECKSKTLNIILELRDEPWGQRHFILSDPSGVMIDVIKVIEPSDEFKAHYAK
jgi:uncharacterized glyoxalase superfamily protein PhnB